MLWILLLRILLLWVGRLLILCRLVLLWSRRRIGLFQFRRLVLLLIGLGILPRV